VFTSTTDAPAAADVDVVFVPVFRDEEAISDLEGLEAAALADLSRAREAGEFRGKPYEVYATRTAGSAWRARRVAIVGAGARADLDAERTRRIAAATGYAARRMRARSIGWLVRPGFDAQHVADGVTAAEFDGASYRNRDDAPGPFPERFAIIGPGCEREALRRAVDRGRIIGECANFARTLANEPANVLPPRELASRVAAAALGVGLEVDVLDEDRIRALGMNLVMAVAQGSAEAPRVIVLRHRPAGAPKGPVLALVGKGVTFDTGGISIKPADGMERMKDDMAGAAAVAATMIALARLEVPVEVVGVIPSVENMPGSRATRPGDVVRGAGGVAVEIINTDAEGRLILGDALWYAKELGATALVDVATLTGACMVALGRTVSGLFGTPDDWVAAVRAAGARAGDRFWPMPIYEEARDQIRSEIGDIINSAGRAGGAVTAAAFLREFVGSTPWAHLDIAGTAWAESAEPYQPKGATGVALRGLIELAATVASSPARTD
jgi:leucyl aminopeptidase